MKTFNFSGKEIVPDNTCVVYKRNLKIKGIDTPFALFLKRKDHQSGKADTFCESFKTDQERGKRLERVIKETNGSGLTWLLFGEPE